jgi:hypothetical protein
VVRTAFRHNPHTFPRFHFNMLGSTRMNIAMTFFTYRRQIRRMVFMNMPDEIIIVSTFLMLKMMDFGPTNLFT